MAVTDTAIVADGLRKSFGDVHAVNGVSLEVPTGTVFGLLGVNDAGKTTIVRMLTTVLKPDAGHGIVNGLDVVEHAQSVRRSIGLARQYAAVDENLTGRARQGPISGGMRRRPDLGAALVAHPPVLFLDEPTTGLDPASRLALWDVIESLVSDGTTVLLTTQYLEEADRLADNIVVINEGAIAAPGTVSQLKATLGETVIELQLHNESEVEAGAAALHTATFAGVIVRVTMASGPATLRDTLNALDAAGITPMHVALREPTLDDVFLDLTTRNLASGAAQ